MPLDITNPQFKSDVTSDTNAGVTSQGLYGYHPQYENYLKGNRVSNPELLMQTPYYWGNAVPDNFGQEDYDRNLDLTRLQDGYSVENLRAEQQSGLEQLGNSFVKFLGQTGTAAINTAAGTLWGLGSMISGGSMVDNDLLEWTSSVNQWFEENFPNYYTKEQQESPWYSPTNLLSVNFWGDKLLKNAGFTVGSALGAMPVSGGIGALGALMNIGTKATAVARGIGGTLVASIGEANFEAYNTKTQFKEAKQMELDNKFLEDMQAIDAQYGNTEMGQRLKAERRHNYELASASLEEASTNAANMDWLLNMAILMPSNFSIWGKVFGGRDFTMAKKVARGELGQLKNPITGTFGNIAKNFAIEGSEEVLQEVASRSSGFANEQGIYDLYELGENNTSRNRANEIVEGIGRGLIDALSDSTTWEQFFIGGLTGALGGVNAAVHDFKERKDYQKDIDYANSRINSGALKEEWQNLVRQQGTQSDMEASAMSGDEASYKNAKHANIVSDIITFDRLGRLEDYKSFLQSAQGHLSDEDIESIIQSTGQNGPYVDENGNPKSYDEVRNMIKSKIDDTMNMVNKYQSIKDDIIKNSSRQLTNEELQNVLWYKMAWDNKQERIEKMGTELKDYFKDRLVESDVYFANFVNRRKLSNIDSKLKSKQKSLEKLQQEGKGNLKAAQKLESEIQDLQVERNNIKIIESPQSEKIKNLDEQIRNKVKQRETILGGNRTLFTDSDVEAIDKGIETLTKEQKEAKKEQRQYAKTAKIINDILNMQGGLSMLHILNNEDLYNALYDVIESDKNTDSDAKASLMKKLNDIITLNDQQNAIKETVDKILTNPAYLQNHKVKIDAKYQSERKQQQVDKVKEKILGADSFKKLNEIDKDTPSEIYNEAVSQINKAKEIPVETKSLLKNYKDFKDLSEQIISISNNLQTAETVNTADLEFVISGINDLLITAFNDSLGSDFIETQLEALKNNVNENQQKIVDEFLDNLSFNENAQSKQQDLQNPDWMTSTPEYDNDEPSKNEDKTKNKKEESTKKTLDLIDASPDEYEAQILLQSSTNNEGRLLLKAIVDGTADIVGVDSQEDLNYVKQIANRFWKDDGREKGVPIQYSANRYNAPDAENSGAGEGNSENNNPSNAGKPNLRSFKYTKWKIEESKKTPQSGKGQRKAELFMPDGITQPQEVVDLDRLGAFDFVEKGYLADLYNAYSRQKKQLPIKLIQLGENTQDYKSLIGETLLAVEMDSTYNKLFNSKNYLSIEVEGVNYQIIGILGANKEGETVLQQIKNIVSNAHTNKNENYVHSTDMNIGHLYTGRMVLTNEQFPNLEERELQDILNGENPLFMMYYTDSDIKGPFGGMIDAGRIVSLNTENPNKRDGSLWLLTKEADGRYYYKAVQVARYNSWFEKHSKDTDNPILNKLKRQFAILCDKTKSETQRASAKGIIGDILYFPESKLNFDTNSGVITFNGNPLNTESALEDMVEQCLNSLTNYNLHFQIRPHHLSEASLRNEIIQSGIITTNLAQLHNINASFDLVMPQIENNNIITPKQPDTKVVGHTGNPLNYVASQKTQVGLGNAMYRIDDNTLEVTTLDGSSVNEDVASEVILKYKISKDQVVGIGKNKNLYEGSYNNGKKFYMKVTGDSLNIIKEGTEEFNKLQEELKKEEAKQNANNVSQQAQKESSQKSFLEEASEEQLNEMAALFGESPSEEETSPLEKAIFSTEPVASEEIQETKQPVTSNEAMNKLKSDIQAYNEQQKRKEVGSDTQETSMGNKNSTMSMAEQASNSFNKASRKKEIRTILSSNGIKNIDAFIDYCIKNNKDVTTAILNEENLKSWIEKNMVCKQ